MKTHNPNIKFDLSLMETPNEHDNTWFLRQFQVESVRNELLGKIKDADDMESIYDVVMNKYKEGNGVETNLGTY